MSKREGKAGYGGGRGVHYSAERTMFPMEGITVWGTRFPRRRKEKKDKGNHSSPGTWPSGVQLPTSHPPGCPCWKMQELSRKEELKGEKRVHE